VVATAITLKRASHLTDRYRRILVPLLAGPASTRALDAACRLAAERKAVVTGLAVVEVPPLLPLDARMDEEEEEARQALARGETVADAYGVAFKGRQVRARDTAAVILDAIEASNAELVVVGAERKVRARRGAPPFARAVQHVLRGAPCRVLLIAPPPAA
jgi:nucleotide-binding universal stress UspA family protein